LPALEQGGVTRGAGTRLAARANCAQNNSQDSLIHAHRLVTGDSEILNSEGIVSEDNKGKRVRPKLSRRESIFLSVSDITTVALILIDLFYFLDVLKIGQGLLIAVNIIMVIVSYVAYQLKRKVRRRTIRAMRRDA